MQKQLKLNLWIIANDHVVIVLALLLNEVVVNWLAKWNAPSCSSVAYFEFETV